MTYYIILKGESPEVIRHDARILGETTEKSKIFYPAGGFQLLTHLINGESEHVETLTILDETKKQYTIEKFLKVLSKCSIAKI